ncbi:ABC transporter ATP-binding protein [Caldinitratiruptor microaerophilus]|uniref:ABC transporter ATP-binding protein n=1 Tax=Caldinitratiruptor microaerophilus TaxID=671077 RepID=A0AA35CHJ5_9FIRM|nr:ABC transporter ATP-binding protein [Caldinitratiruptor microaerophilus]BDG58982.1 ABC transporter ATP-binding protein [Caldinitratiruptor microaerophilus]
MLEVKGLTVAYGSYLALRDIHIQVARGELVVILGANGAGKSTLFRTLSGLRRPVSGTVEFDGRRVDGLRPDQIVRLGMSHCPEARHLFPHLSVEKNLLLGAYTRRDRREVVETLREVYDLFPALRAKQHQPAGALSGGQQQMVAIGRALMARPKLLLLDEPSLGLAPLVVRDMFRIIRSIHERGTTVLLSEQNAQAALKLADRAYVIENGQIVMTGLAEELVRSEDVRRAYIGA